jgi:hypothetical protein
MPDFLDVPKDMVVEESIVSKSLKSGMSVEIWLVKRPRQYEAALFLDGKYRPGPPVPRPLDSPGAEVTHWMGVRPSVGLTDEEAEAISSEVNIQNVLHHMRFKDEWGVEPD